MIDSGEKGKKEISVKNLIGFTITFYSLTPQMRVLIFGKGGKEKAVTYAEEEAA